MIFKHPKSFSNDFIIILKNSVAKSEERDKRSTHASSEVKLRLFFNYSESYGQKTELGQAEKRQITVSLLKRRRILLELVWVSTITLII